MLPSELEELIEQAAREEWEELNLAGMEIEVLPASIANCKKLKKLILGQRLTRNKLTSLPVEIGELENLQYLYLDNNNLSEIPDSITHLYNLQYLNLNSNNLGKIPDSITHLYNLQSLDLDNNNLREIPDSITRLAHLHSLTLRKNRLNQIPDSITHLPNLQFLNLASNNIDEISHSVRLFSKLSHLNLENNLLSEFPEYITSLYILSSLNLADNNLNKIPDSIRNLLNLRELNLDNTNLREIPESISQLSNLRYLSLSKNSLNKIPDSILHLENLEYLSLRSNNLSHIPESIKSLSNLQFLNLSDNQIILVPETLIQLPKLFRLTLAVNPITNPPLEVVEKGIEAIRQYFRQIKEEGEDYLYEAKLLIVGEPYAGKTTLANKIINPDYELCKQDTTKGIEIKRWKFRREDGIDFAVNIWDFGGQEIYKDTHQFFLTKRSLYTLVADNRQEDTDFYHWLNVVGLLSENSPILIIKNERDDRHREININQLRGEFNSLKEEISTNFANNKNLDTILSACKYYLNQLPHIGQPLPKTWVKVRRALENDPRNYISLSEYLQICEDNGFKERKNKLQLSDYLNDLGICLHFQDDEMSPLYQIVILKPKWGTDAAYAVLDNPEVIRNFGRFSNKELAQIWSADEYTGMHSGLLELMKKFQLCYEIPQEKGSYIAPQLLTENQPEYAWDESENLILRYTYDFMPKGIVRQFIVAMHQDIESQNVWRSGVIIHKSEYSHTRAEVIENYGKREIKIRVSGKNKRDLLTVVTHELDKIHNSYKRLADKYQKLIPCNCNTCKGSQNPHFYEFTNLKRRYANRKHTVECDLPPYESVEVLGLIDDIGAKSQLQDSRRNSDLEYPADYALKDVSKIPSIIIQNNFSPTNTNHMETSPQPPNPSPKIKSAWANGSFYLFLFVVVILSIGYLAGNLPIQNLIAVIIAGIIFIPLIGALQLRQDDRLSENNFMELIKLVIAQLPLIGNIFKPLLDKISPKP